MANSLNFFIRISSEFGVKKRDLTCETLQDAASYTSEFTALSPGQVLK